MGRLCNEVVAMMAATVVAAATGCCIWWIMDDDDARKKQKVEKAMKDLEVEFETNVEMLKEVAEEMQKKMSEGLSHHNSEIKMLVTYFDAIDSVHFRLQRKLEGSSNDSSERYIYALDLGGTNVRALRFKLTGDGKRITEDGDPVTEDGDPVTEDGDPVVKVVPLDCKIGTLRELFDFLAETVKDLIDKEGNSDVNGEKKGKGKELGFCFSFPVTNTAIDAGTLTNWTKDYDIGDTEGCDLVKELRDAFDRKNLKELKVGALVNDTVGTLAIGHLQDPNCLAGVIFGTGTNAAYIEDAGKIKKGEGGAPFIVNNGHPYGLKKMVINMEWGNFNPPDKLLTEYDRLADTGRHNQHQQIFEKMVSGKYLGEIVGQVLLKLVNEVELFGGSRVKVSEEHYYTTLGTDVVNEMHSDPYLAGEVFKVGKGVCHYESKIVAKVCKLVVKRAARLSAAAIVAILTQLGKVTVNAQQGDKYQPTVIAIDGSLYDKYGKFRKYLKEALEDILGKDFNRIVTLKKVKDGSGLGAAIIAACYSETT